MRKVTFKIDDKNFLENEYNSTKIQLENLQSFKVIYSITGYKNNADKYSLTDYDDNKININSLNGYQNMILNDCFEYFSNSNRRHFETRDKRPYGVIEIIEEEI